MIIFDLEWNRGYDNRPLDEILQIGAVRLAGLGQPVQDSFNVYIRPRVHKRFGPGAKNLPDLRASVESDVDFSRGMALFLEWCGGEREFAAWGRDDFKAIRQNCEYWKLPLPEFPLEYDLQRAYGRLFSPDGNQVALQQAIAERGIPARDAFHNALHDAMYTAAVSAWIPEKALTCLAEEKAGRKVPRFSDLTFPPQPRRRAGPFQTVQALLNSRAVRQVNCPVCGEKLWIRRWAGPLGQRYYAAFRCPEHGRFLCRATLAAGEDGQWRARLAVPAAGPAQVEEYRQALEQGSALCRSGGAGKRRRSRRKKPAAAEKQRNEQRA